jgi:hypothetical protein
MGWGDVSTTVEDNPSTFKSVASASIGNNLHVVGLTENGNMWHKIRFPKRWGDAAAVLNNPGSFMSAAGVSIAHLHVISKI